MSTILIGGLEPELWILTDPTKIFDALSSFVYFLNINFIKKIIFFTSNCANSAHSNFDLQQTVHMHKGLKRLKQENMFLPYHL